MEKEMTKNRQATEQLLIDAVDCLIEENGFEGLGINAVAAKAGVSKMLIYRYFHSLDGLIATYIQQHDYWINFKDEAPDAEHLGEFIKTIFKKQIKLLRESYPLRRLYRWELSTNNAQIKQLRDEREEKGLWIVDTVSRLSGHPHKETAALATILSAAISYLVLLAENYPAYNGIRLQEESGWAQIENSIDLLVDMWLKKK